MSQYHWVKNPLTKQSKLVPVDPVSTPRVEIARPVGTTPNVAARRVRCTACSPPKLFGTAGVLALHFRREHRELSDTKDSFRRYMESVS